MIGRFFKLPTEIIRLFQRNNTSPQTKAVFKALADSIVPRTDKFAENPSSLHAIGALDVHTDEYPIYSLEHYAALRIMLRNFNIYLANATAEMLNTAARQLIAAGENGQPVNPAVESAEGTFAALGATDRCRAIALLEQLRMDLTSLPVPFRNNPWIVLDLVSILTMLNTTGYYSEWSGYGSTRLEAPEKRVIEHFPAGWRQVGYPGPSQGYHALRGYLIDNFTE